MSLLINETVEKQMHLSFETKIIFKKCSQYSSKQKKSESKMRIIKNYCIVLAK